MAELDLVDALARTYTAATDIVDHVGDDQWSAPTPCEEWDVRAVVEHLTGGVMTYTNALADGTGERPSADDPAALFRQATAENLAAWRQPGALERTLQMPWGESPASMAININLIDAYQHAWDVARATGQPTSQLDPDVGGYALEFTTRMIGQMGRGEMFADETPCPPDAPVADRLAAFLGRRV